MGSKPFYEPLFPGETRVLYLDFSAPDGNSTTLSASMITISVEKESDLYSSAESLHGYDALSYCWGDQTKTRSILCNGKTLPVHANLYYALLAVKEQRTSRPIWTDAICINQTDKKEKMAQIQMMGTIYRNAEQVWAWLGHEVERTAETISNIPRFCQHLEQNWQEGFRSGTSLPVPPFISAPALQAIVYSEYFDRLWILQEAALAKEVVFLSGKHQISWATMEIFFNPPAFMHLVYYESFKTLLNRAVFEARTHFNTAPVSNYSDILDLAQTTMDLAQTRLEELGNQENPRLVTDYAKAIAQKAGSTSLQSLLDLSATQKCSEAKDRIFGIFALLQIQQGSKCTYPWTMEQCTEEMYIETFYYLAKQGQTAQDSTIESLENFPALGISAESSWAQQLVPVFDGNASSLSMLSLAPPPADSMLLLPSWCPNFHTAGKREDRFGAMVRDWRASSRKQQISRAANSTELELKGVCVGWINTILSGWKKIPLQGNNVTEIRAAATHDLELLHDCLAQADSRGHDSNEGGTKSTCSLCAADHDGNIPEYLWRTLLVEQITMPGRPNLTVGDFQDLLQYLHHLAYPDVTIPQELSHRRWIPPRSGDLTRVHYFLAGMNHLENRVLFQTENGLIGLGPAEVQVDDMLCVLQGAKVPHVLRLNPEYVADGDSGSCFWTFLGEGYAHDIMHGEAEVGGDGVPLDAETFTLV